MPMHNTLKFCLRLTVESGLLVEILVPTRTQTTIGKRSQIKDETKKMLPLDMSQNYPSISDVPKQIVTCMSLD
jgi:hypothetical protein